MTSKSLGKALPFLKLVSNLSNQNRRRVLRELGGDKTVYNALNEIAHNTIKGKVKLNKSQSRKLKPHRKILENLCKPTNRNCSKKRKSLIVQSGGFLPILIPALATILSTIIK